MRAEAHRDGWPTFRQAAKGLYPVLMQVGLKMTDDLDTRRRRALYRAHHRGTKELDFLIGRYADARLIGLPLDELLRFERLLAIADPTLQEWIFSGTGFANEFEAVVSDIRAFHGLSSPADR
jgi:antitoxin CptB